MACCPATAIAAEDKYDDPAVTHLVQENRDGVYRSIADWPQGTQFPFKVTGDLPTSLNSFARPYEYWLVATPGSTLNYLPGTASVKLLRGGAETDVTAALSVAYVGGSIVAGSTDIKAALPTLKASDKLVLYYTCEYAASYNLGFGTGNPSWAHVEYVPAARMLGAQSARRAGLSAQDDDPRSAGLSSSPDVKATVYCYALDVLKVGANTKQPLQGAGFTLRDDEGKYYVKDKPWSPDASQATVMTTGQDGKVLFAGLDHDVYELVEVQAPSGYKTAGPIDVTIETTIPDERESITVSSRTVTITNANSTTGTIGFTVEDPVSDENPGEDPDNPPAPVPPADDDPSDKPGDDPSDDDGDDDDDDDDDGDDGDDDEDDDGDDDDGDDDNGNGGGNNNGNGTSGNGSNGSGSSIGRGIAGALAALGDPLTAAWVLLAALAAASAAFVARHRLRLARSTQGSLSGEHAGSGMDERMGNG